MNKKIPCPNCGKMTIEVAETPKSCSYKRGFTGKKGFVYYRGHTTILTKICPECNKKYGEVEHEKRTHEGLPTRIETVY